MSDFFQRVSEQVIQRSATGVQPLRTLHFAPVPATDLRSPLELRQQQVAASPFAENPDALDLAATQLPNSLVPPDSAMTSRPIPSFRQMGQAAALMSSPILPQSSLPASLVDEMAFDEEAIASQAEAATPAPLPRSEPDLDPIPAAFVASATEGATSKINDGTIVEAPAPTASTIAAVGAPGTQAHSAASTVVQAPESSAGLIRRQPAISSTAAPIGELSTGLASESTVAPRPAHTQAAEGAGIADLGQSDEVQVGSVGHEMGLAPSLPSPLEQASPSLAAPQRLSVQAQGRPDTVVESSAEVLPAEKRPIDDTHAIYDPPLAMSTALPATATPNSAHEQRPVTPALAHEQDGFTTIQPESGVMPSSLSAPSRLSAPVDPRADDAFVAPVSHAPVNDLTPALQSVLLAGQLPIAPGTTPRTEPLTDQANDAPVMPVVSAITSFPVPQATFGLTPAELEAPTSNTALQNQPVITQPVAERQITEQDVSPLPAVPPFQAAVTQPSSLVDVTLGYQTDETPVVPVLRAPGASSAVVPELESAAQEVVEPSARGIPSEQQTLHSVGSSPATAPVRPPESPMISGPVVAQPTVSRALIDAGRADEAQVTPVTRNASRQGTQPRDLEPTQALLVEPGRTAVPVDEPVAAPPFAPPTSELFTENAVQVAQTAPSTLAPLTLAPLTHDHVEELPIMPVVRATPVTETKQPTFEQTQESFTQTDRVTELVARRPDTKLPSSPTSEPVVGNAPERPPQMPLALGLAAQPPSATTAVPGDAGSAAEPSVVPVVHKQAEIVAQQAELESVQERLIEPSKLSEPLERPVDAGFSAPQTVAAADGSVPALQTKPSPASHRSSATTGAMEPGLHPEAKISPVASPTLVTRATAQALRQDESSSAATSEKFVAELGPVSRLAPVALTASEAAQRKASVVTPVSVPSADTPPSVQAASVQPTLPNQLQNVLGPVGAPEADLPADVTRAPKIYPAITPVVDVALSLAKVNPGSIDQTRPAGSVVAPVTESRERIPGPASIPLRVENERVTGSPSPVADAERREQGRQPLTAQETVADIRPSVSMAANMAPQLPAYLSLRQREAVQPAANTTAQAVATQKATQNGTAQTAAEQFVGLPSVPEPAQAVEAGIRPRSEPPAPSLSPKAQAAAQQPLPTIRVTIGRVEVRTTPEMAKPASPQRQPGQAALSLDAYLKRKKQEAR